MRKPVALRINLIKPENVLGHAELTYFVTFGRKFPLVNTVVNRTGAPLRPSLLRKILPHGIFGGYKRHLVRRRGNSYYQVVLPEHSKINRFL